MKRLFTPILAGATLRDRLFACAGGVVGISITSFVSWIVLGPSASILLVAPMGASAVLVFAVPASPLAQPWSVVGGNIVSALVGVAAAKLIAAPHIAAGVAVGGAILAMSLLRCLHPPGGAAALTAVIGGPTVAAAGFGFAIAPVGLNAVLLTLAGILFHRLTQHSYPHTTKTTAIGKTQSDIVRQPNSEDVAAALEDLGESFDISPDDLELLVRRINFHAARRDSRHN